MDKSAITKIKTRVAPDLLSKDDINAQDIAGRPGMAARALGQWVRRVSRKIFTE